MNDSLRSFTKYVEWVLAFFGSPFNVFLLDEDPASPTSLPEHSQSSPFHCTKRLSEPTKLEWQSGSLPWYQSLKIRLTRCVSQQHHVSLWESSWRLRELIGTPPTLPPQRPPSSTSSPKTSQFLIHCLNLQPSCPRFRLDPLTLTLLRHPSSSALVSCRPSSAPLWSYGSPPLPQSPEPSASPWLSRSLLSPWYVSPFSSMAPPAVNFTVGRCPAPDSSHYLLHLGSMNCPLFPLPAPCLPHAHLLN
ncbi:hypothetical protein H4Q32_011931 [Labeo rohita]|uniref:Uncharacterized protein n=1 Tax=Labeo rohita TaxID=84645 RepID=A0ABQ8MKN8_LABRO|nr:hypothetical protein H4Q32_011931 [Labeo rohita]